MFSDRERVIALLEKAIEEMHLILAMSEPIKNANDFGVNLEGMTIFRNALFNTIKEVICPSY